MKVSAAKKNFICLAAGAAGNLSSARGSKTSLAFTPHGTAIELRAPNAPTHSTVPLCSDGLYRYPRRARKISTILMASSRGSRNSSRSQSHGNMFHPIGRKRRQHEHSAEPYPNPQSSRQRTGSNHRNLAGSSLAATMGTARVSEAGAESGYERSAGESQWSFMFSRFLGVLRKYRRKVAAIPASAADEGRFLATAAFIGVLTGTAVTAFKILIGLVKEKSYDDLMGWVPAEAAKYAVGGIPVLGALGVVALMWILRLKSYGPGLGGLTEEVDKEIPWNPKRTVGKTLAAVATLGTGNSLGPEGPAVELGVAASRWAASLTELSVERQRMLLGAGAAAGVAAGFNAPIAGVFFAIEIVKNTFNSNVNSKSFIAGTLLCSVVSALIAKIGLHDELALRPAPYHLESPLIELPLYLGLGVVSGLVAVMFKFFSRKSGDLFGGNMIGFRWMKRVPKWSKPIAMATVTGLVGIVFPQVLFFGYDTLDNLLLNTRDYGIGFLSFLCVAKALLTAGALGSGLVGGTFAPSLFLGATAGAAYQEVLQGLLTAVKSGAGPSLGALSTSASSLASNVGLSGTPEGLGSLLTIAGPPAYAMVGAAAVLSALYRAPLTGSLLMFELTKDYDIVLPLMAAAGVSSVVVEIFSPPAGEAPEPTQMPRDMSLEIGLKTPGTIDELMRKIQVEDALVPRVLVFTPDASLSEAISAFRSTRNELAVVASPEALTGAGPAVSGFEERKEGAQGGDGTTCNVRTFLAEELWEKRDLNLVGVLALREILAALEQERSSSAGVKTGPEKMTVGGVCRHDCFTVKAGTDIASARNVMDSKGVRFLPVVALVDPASATESGRLPSVVPEAVQAAKGAQSNHSTMSKESPRRALVGIVSRDSVRIAGRLAETGRALSGPPPSTSESLPAEVKVEKLKEK